MERELFLEIGLEELPASWMPALNVQIVDKVKARLAAIHLKSTGAIEAFSTPRRLAVVVPSLADRQDDKDEKLMGPPVSAAFGPDGQPTPALQGFARKNNVDLSVMQQEDTPKGRYMTLQKQIRGKATVDVLPDFLNDLLRDLAFPKMMHWDAELGDGKGELQFGRPIRWLLFLYGGRVVPFTISRSMLASSPRVQDVLTGANTYGHRFLATSGRAGRAIKVRSFDEYKKRLAEQFVLISRAERRDRIRRELESAARKLGGHVVAKGLPQAEALLEEVPDLVEYPSVVAGGFGAEFLSLPAEVLTTTLIHHQHFFPVADSSGKLLPAFLAVTNTQPASDRSIAQNAERVVTARLRDARFFWDSDRRFTTATDGATALAGLEARLPRLKTVLFHKALGSYGDKVTRIEALARWIATDVLQQSDAVAEQAARAARLAKADLATDMVGEFPELQGVIGGVYARDAGEPEAVWKAIYHHYAPVGVEKDAPPSMEALGPAKMTWAAVSLADKLDTLAGLFAAGEKPTGSRDPFGMRRAAQGVVKILADLDVPLGLTDPLSVMLRQAGDGFPSLAGGAASARDMADFMKERLVHLLEKRGVSASVAGTVAGSWHAPKLALQKAEALGREMSKQASELPAVAELYKRAANITKNLPDTAVDMAAVRPALKEPAEVALADALALAAPAIAHATAAGDYAAAIAALVKLRAPVDRFFTDVMVMVDDAALRDARLALVLFVRMLVSREIGDLTQLGVIS